jgi:acyl carrier protein
MSSQGYFDNRRYFLSPVRAGPDSLTVVSARGIIRGKPLLRLGIFMNGRIERIFADVLRIPLDSIKETSSPDNTPKWDSAAAIDLVLAVEDEFKIRLTTKEIMAMRSIALVKKILAAKGISDV